MKIAYAFRRNVFYPYRGGRPSMPTGATFDKYVAKLREIGFEGIELGGAGGDEAAKQAQVDLGKRLRDGGVPCVAISSSGSMSDPKNGAAYRRGWENGIKMAALIGAGIVNGRMTGGVSNPKGKGAGKGETVSQGGSRDATEYDFVVNAKALRELGDMAADNGVTLAVEVHQHGIVDNSWSALHLMEMVNHPNVGINPDLGNIYWCYDEPEETNEAAVMAMAPKTVYWHCKNLRRIHVPQLEQAYFIYTPLPDGDLDYRFAISAMVAAGYKGYLAVEGMRQGDQITNDGRGVEYVRAILKELGA